VDGGRLIDWVTGKDVKTLGLSTAWWLHSTATYGGDKVWLVQSMRDIRTGAVAWNTDLKLRGHAEMYLQPVVVGDIGYFIRGCHGAGGPMCAMDLKTGRELWRGPSWGTWIAVGDKLLAHGGGRVAVIRTGKAQYEEEGPAYRFTPALSQGYPLIAYANKQFYVMAHDGLTCMTTAFTAPSLSNGAATWSPAARTARLSGTLVNTGGKPAQFFIHWGKADGGTDPAQWANTISLGPRQPGELSADTTALERNAFYYYRCSATNSLGRRWASETLRFSTPDPMNLGNDTALAMHWTFDQVAGGKIADAGPNGVTATVHSPQRDPQADGVIGQSLRFGRNQSLTGSRMQPALRGDFTVTLWVRLGEKHTSSRYFLRLQPAQLHLGFKESVPLVNNVAAKSALQPNRWHHLALTRTGGQHMVYLDGAPICEPVPAADDPYNQALLRFADEGQLDDLRVYRRTLTVEEIRQLAAPAKR